MKRKKYQAIFANNERILNVAEVEAIDMKLARVTIRSRYSSYFIWAIREI